MEVTSKKAVRLAVVPEKNLMVLKVMALTSVIPTMAAMLVMLPLWAQSSLLKPLRRCLQETTARS